MEVLTNYLQSSSEKYKIFQAIFEKNCERKVKGP